MTETHHPDPVLYWDGKALPTPISIRFDYGSPLMNFAMECEFPPWADLGLTDAEFRGLQVLMLQTRSQVFRISVIDVHHEMANSHLRIRVEGNRTFARVPLPRLRDWIEHDWPHARLDDEHLIVWKRVGQKQSHSAHIQNRKHDGITIDGRYFGPDEISDVSFGPETSYVGNLGCEYELNRPMKTNGITNFTLSPLGALTEPYDRLDHLLACVVRWDDLTMRDPEYGDQVLEAQNGLPVLPVYAIQAEAMLTQIGADVTPELVKEWLENPNRHASEIEAAEIGMARRVHQELRKVDWRRAEVRPRSSIGCRR